MAQTQSITIKEFAQINEPGHFDLIRGELIRMPPTGGLHGEIAMELARHVANFVADHRLGKVYIDETGFVLSVEPPIVLAPDLAFVRQDRLPPIEERQSFLRLAPDLAVEIVSPSDRMSQVRSKVDEYLHAGTRLVWVIEPRARRATVYQPGSPAETLSGDAALHGRAVLPGFQLSLGTLFE